MLFQQKSIRVVQLLDSALTGSKRSNSTITNQNSHCLIAGTQNLGWRNSLTAASPLCWTV